MLYFLSSFILKDVFLMQKVTKSMAKTLEILSLLFIFNAWGRHSIA